MCTSFSLSGRKPQLLTLPSPNHEVGEYYNHPSSQTFFRESGNAKKETLFVYMLYPGSWGMPQPSTTIWSARQWDNAMSACPCLFYQDNGRVPHPSLAACIIRLSGKCKFLCQCLCLQGEFQLSPTPLADTFRLLANESPSHIV